MRELKVWVLGRHDICVHVQEKSRKQPGELEVGFTNFFWIFQHSGFSISPQAKRNRKKLLRFGIQRAATLGLWFWWEANSGFVMRNTYFWRDDLRFLIS